jgi:hypothetical protein
VGSGTTSKQAVQSHRLVVTFSPIFATGYDGHLVGKPIASVNSNRILTAAIAPKTSV